ncbi:MAG: hypothetical protein RR446_09900 [Lachnospiraceae bacterium]
MAKKIAFDVLLLLVCIAFVWKLPGFFAYGLLALVIIVTTFKYILIIRNKRDARNQQRR